MPTGGFFENTGEKVLEMGQSTAQTVKKQVVGGLKQDLKKQIVGDKNKTGEGGKAGAGDVGQKAREQGSQQFGQMMGKMKKMNQQQLAAAKKQDLQGAVGEAGQVRAQLKQEQIRRYQQIQREIQEYRGKKGEEIPKYISGKPGEASTPEEQQEKMEKQEEEQKKIEEEKKKDSSLSPFAERMKGSREKGRVVAG